MHCRIATVLLLASASPAAALAGITGRWQGTFSVAGRVVPIAVDLSEREKVLKGALSLPECGFSDFPIPTLEASDTKLTFAVPAGWGLPMFRDIGLRPEDETIKYEGAVSGDEIVGTIWLAGQGFPLRFTRGRQVEKPYRTEGVRFTNGDVTLAGSLLLPAGAGKHPVIVFVHGSGDRTRNGHRYEADLVARHGVAALIYDKRGAGESTGANWEVATLQELASDAQAAISFLTTRTDIDRDRIGMFGLSQGTWIIVIVASHSADVSFLISVSGSGIPIWEQDLYRTESMMRAEGFPEADIREASTFMRQKFEVGRTGLGWEALEARIAELKQANVKWFPGYTGNATSILSPRFWWLSFFSYDPARDLECVRAPVLTILGGRDLAFPTQRVAARMKEYLPPNQGHLTKIIPIAEHSMLSPLSVGGRALFQSTDPEYMKTMLDWLQRVVVQGRIRKAAARGCNAHANSARNVTKDSSHDKAKTH